MRISFSFDTNILIYSADPNTGEKHSTAREIIRRSVREHRGLLTEQSLMEFLYASRKKRSIPFRDAVTYVDTVLSLFELLLAKDDIVRRTLQIISRYELNIWDARMIALCATHNCTVLFSEDMQDRGHYDGVRVINPLILGNLEIVDEILTS